MPRTSPALATLLLVALALPAAAAPLRDEAAARRAGAEVLKGDPYGATLAEAAARISVVRRIPGTESACRSGPAPVWEMRVRVPAAADGTRGAIDGPLVLDATTGRLLCAGLPFLD